MKNSKINVPSPSVGKPVRVPVVMQMEALECGAACLDMILAYYKRFVPLEQVRSDCGVSRDGSSAKNILKAARSYGFKAKALLIDVNGLKEKGKFPCIIHWNFNHFVVLDGFKGKNALLNDPAKGTVKVPLEEFEKAYKRFTEPSLTDKPIFFELFTDEKSDDKAFSTLINLATDSKHQAKTVLKNILGKQGTQMIKKLKK